MVSSQKQSMDRLNDLRSPKMIKRCKAVKNGMVPSQSVNSPSRCRLNVGGMYFEILQKNLSRFPDTLLGGERKKCFYDEDRQEYFFDRDPVPFKQILDFYRTGKFHISTPECIESIRDELAFFGIAESYVSECCCEHFTFQCEIEEEEKVQQKALPESYSRKRKVYTFLTDFESSLAATFFSYFFVIVVVINICLIVGETLDCDAYTKCGTYHATFFFVVDSFCVAVFTFEYFARLYSCPNRRGFMRDYSNLVDLIGILPYYLGIVEKMAKTNHGLLLYAITILRIFRIFRVIKLARHSEQFQNLLHSIAQAGGELGGILFSFLALMVMFSTIIFLVEDGGSENPDGFTSIPSAFWYTLVTMTTLGYGDIVPSTFFGKIIGSICALAGVVLLALPVPIIEEKLNENNRKLIRRREVKQSVTAKLTKRLAVSLASLRSFPRRFRHATSQSSLAVEISNEMQSEIKYSSEKISIDESSSDETIKASSHEISATNPVEVHCSSPCNTKHYFIPLPQRYMESRGKMHYGESDASSKSSESSICNERGGKMKLHVETHFDSCETLHRGADSQEEGNATNYESTDHESYRDESDVSDHEKEFSSGWISPI